MSEFEKEPSKKAVPAANAVNEFEEGLYNKNEGQIRAELAALELESAELDIEIKREQVAKIKAARQAKLDENRIKTETVLSFLRNREAAQNSCNHLKGGQGPEAVMYGRGSDQMHCVVKHKLPHGKYFVLCTR